MLLPQEEDFRCFRVLFKREGRLKIDRRISGASAVMYRSAEPERQSRAFLLWGKSTNHYSTVQPLASTPCSKKIFLMKRRAREEVYSPSRTVLLGTNAWQKWPFSMLAPDLFLICLYPCTVKFFCFKVLKIVNFLLQVGQITHRFDVFYQSSNKCSKAPHYYCGKRYKEGLAQMKRTRLRQTIHTSSSLTNKTTIRFRGASFGRKKALFSDWLGIWL